MTSYYGDHDGLLHLPRIVNGAEGGLLGLGLSAMAVWSLSIGIWITAAAIVVIAAHAVADSEPMCSRRFERRRIAKIEADRAAGVWPR